MADIFVEMAIYDGALNINPQANMEGTSKYILQQHKITGTVFMDSYNYYLSQKQMESIFDSAEKKTDEKKIRNWKHILKRKIKELRFRNSIWRSFFEVEQFSAKGKARAGVITTDHGKIQTPIFYAGGYRSNSKNCSSERIER